MKAFILIVIVLLLEISCFTTGAENVAYPKEEVTWKEKDFDAQRNAGKELWRKLKLAIKNENKKFDIPKGVYRFDTKELYFLHIAKAKNLHIEGNGSLFFFSSEGIRRKKDSILLDRCENLTITNLSFDYYPLPFTQGRVSEINEKKRFVKIKLDAGFPEPDKKWVERLGGVKTIFLKPDETFRETILDWMKSFEMDSAKRELKIFFMHGWIFGKPPYKTPVKIGDYLILPDRRRRMLINSNNCSGLKLENLTIYSSPNMAIAEHMAKSQNIYKNIKIIPRPGTKRLLSSNADAIHITSSDQGPVIRDCEIGFAGDDAINVKGWFDIIQEVKAANKVRIVMHFTENIKKGTRLQFYDYRTFKMKGKAQVLSIKKITDRGNLDKARDIPNEYRKRKIKFHSMHKRLIFVLECKLDKKISNLKFLDIVRTDYGNSQKPVIENNYIHNIYAGGMRLNASGALIKNNHFKEIGMSAINAGSDIYWLEGPFPHDFKIIGNKIENANCLYATRLMWSFRPAAIFVGSKGGARLTTEPLHERVIIENNTILNSSAAAIVVMNIEGGSISSNTIDGVFAKKQLEKNISKKYGLKIDESGIIIINSKNIKVANNKIKNAKNKVSIWTSKKDKGLKRNARQ